ncbi:hypothetical protein LCGC14_1054970 [marine sediment metagenome]|uniref:Uncharacterized protein n=1 Tax=marine sediment metagenome TaxID=412755 RepID=A0A0F9N9P0_9ZZZZ
MKMQGPIETPYDDCVIKKPDPGSAAGASFGKALSDGSKPTKGIMEEVQLSDVGPKPGTKQGQIRIPGGGSY